MNKVSLAFKYELKKEKSTQSIPNGAIKLWQSQVRALVSM